MKTAVTALILAALSACSSTVHKPFSLDGDAPTSLSLDVRQRVVLNTFKGGDKRNKHVVCAEPSPDALIIRAASAALQANLPQANSNVSAGASSSEGGGFIGQRTQTIQLLRDGLYRACEAYMNGAISDDDYNWILAGYDDFVVTVMAIDGLTAAKSVPPVAINSSANFNGGGQAGGGGAAPSGNTNTTVNVNASPDPARDKEIGAMVKEIVDKYLDHKISMAAKRASFKRGSGEQK